MLLAGFTVLLLFSGYIVTGIKDVINAMFSMAPTFSMSPTNVRFLLMDMIWKFFLILLPLFGFLALAAIMVNVIQVGLLFTGEPLVPKLDKINPVEGFKRIFSRRSLETLVRDIIKIVVVLWIAYVSIRGVLPGIMGMTDYSVGQIFAYAGSTVFSIAMKILIGYVVIAVLDYAFQRWDYERSIMMTRQEIREELKQTEGDPIIRAHIRTLQREMARRRMMEEVPKAEVVITNPTDIAVALSYSAEMTAPVVVAKGRRLLAEKIRNIAEEHGIPIVENVLLAQALFKSVDIGQPIPPDLYTAVAEVLAYVYRLKGKQV